MGACRRDNGRAIPSGGSAWPRGLDELGNDSRASERGEIGITARRWLRRAGELMHDDGLIMARECSTRLPDASQPRVRSHPPAGAAAASLEHHGGSRLADRCRRYPRRCRCRGDPVAYRRRFARVPSWVRRWRGVGQAAQLRHVAGGGRQTDNRVIQAPSTSVQPGCRPGR